ncbi:radical SAM family heme chaperone HemW [Acidihalobacter prosperus]
MYDLCEPVPLSLYVHLPWCVRKCPYCDFNSHEFAETLPEREYVEALIADLESELPRVWGRRIESVFIGGGTPSLFSSSAMENLLDGLRARLPLRPDLEITLEANPGTLDKMRFADYRQMGINRLSIGAQSFDDASLHRLGRIHSASEAQQAAEVAHSSGFDNFNLDLMYGLPEQDLSMAQRDIKIALSLMPTHISYYQLTIEPNTYFHHAPPALPEQDLIIDIQNRAQQLLADAGFQQYEVSAYASPGHQCRHNLNYWKFGDYLGIGAGAHGKLTDPGSGTITRRWKLRQPKQYMSAAYSGDATGGSAQAPPRELIFEFMLNALRLRDGFELSLFERRTGLSRTHLANTLDLAVERELIERNGEHVKPSSLGWNYLNDLISLFLS